MDAKVTMCVIDDIKSVVDGITHIPWENYGIEVIGTALDGITGLELIQQRKPDIVLTDIRMPNMGGMEMITRLKESSYAGKIIFFSGYTDLDYLQQAVRLGAFDYIVKPHSVKQIVEIVQKAKKEIEAMRREQLRLQEIHKKVKKSLPVLRQEFFNLLLHYHSSADSIQKRWEFLQIDLEQTDLAVLVIQIDQLQERGLSLPIEEIELIRFSLQNIVEETFASYTKRVIFRDAMNRFVVIYHSPEDLDDNGLAEQCCENIAAFTKFTVSIGCGRTAKYVHELSLAYREAILALSYQFYTGGNVVLTYDDVAGHDQTLPSYSKDREQELGMYLRSGNEVKALEVLKELFAELSGGPALPEPMKLISVYYELGSFVVRVLLEKTPYSELQPLEQKLRDRHWLTTVPLKELQHLLSEICIIGCQWIESRHHSESQAMIHQAIHFIRGRLHTELTVNDCAKHVHLSANYFVNLFKKVTGMTFVQFLTHERIEKAKIMLFEDYQVQEIASAVGYEDRRYFSDVFKKTTGMTPSEYKIHFSKEQ